MEGDAAAPMMRLAHEDRVGHGHDGSQRAKDQKGRRPADQMVESTAEQRREAGSGRHGHHRQGEHAGERFALEEIAGDGSGQHGRRGGAETLDDPPGDQLREASGDGTSKAAGDEHGEAADHERAPSEAVRQWTDEELADREGDEEGALHHAQRRRRDAERSGHGRHGREDDVGRERPQGGQPAEDEQQRPGQVTAQVFRARGRGVWTPRSRSVNELSRGGAGVL